MAKEMMMVPATDYNNFVNYYKGRLTESALLNKAGRLAAERQLTLENKKVPTSVALAVSRPKAREVQHLTKRLCTGGRTQGTTVMSDDDEDDDAMLVSPMEHKLDKILRVTEKTLKQQPPKPLVPLTRRRQLPKTPKKHLIKKEPVSTSKKSGWISSMKRGALKGLGQSMGVNVSRTSDTDSDDESATRQNKKKKPTPKRSNGYVRHRDGKIGWKANNSVELSYRTTRRRRRRTRTKSKNQTGGRLDVQKWLSKTGMEFHWPGYQFMGPGTHLKKRLARGDKGINRLDMIARIHDIDHSRSKNLRDKWAADKKMVKAIENLPGRKTPTEFIVKNIMKAKRRLKL